MKQDKPDLRQTRTRHAHSTAMNERQALSLLQAQHTDVHHATVAKLHKQLYVV